MQVDVTTSDGTFYRAAVLSGASIGMFPNQIFVFFFFFFVIDISLKLVILNLSGEMNYGDDNFHLCC